MKRDPTKTLVELTRSQEELALRRYSALLKQCGSEEEKLAVLEQYRREYAGRLADLSRRGMQAFSLENFKRFMTHLEGAVTQQQDQTGRSRTALDDSMKALQDARRRSKIFETLVQRKEEQERVRDGRRAQSAEDEFAARKFNTPKN